MTAFPPKPGDGKTIYRVLVGNNEPVFDDYLSSLLQQRLASRFRVQVKSVTYADEVIEAAQQEPFDLFFLFLNNILQRSSEDCDALTRIDRAIGLIPRLKAISHRPVVALSGWTDRGFATKVEQAGADIFLEIPFQAQGFLDLLEVCLEHQPKRTA